MGFSQASRFLGRHFIFYRGSSARFPRSLVLMAGATAATAVTATPAPSLGFSSALYSACFWSSATIMNPTSGSYHACRASQGRTDPHRRSRTSYGVGSTGGPGSQLIRRTDEIRVAMVPLDWQGIVQPPDAGLISWSNAKGASVRRRERRIVTKPSSARYSMVRYVRGLGGGGGRGIITHMHGTTIMDVCTMTDLVQSCLAVPRSTAYPLPPG